MKILYLSSHTILEYDEIKLFTELGHQVFSMGAYQMHNGDNGMRPAIPGLFEDQHLRSVSIQCSKENIHPELIEWADVIVSMHNSRVDVHDAPQPWIANNWKKFKDAKKPVIWRSIGQSNGQVEDALAKYRNDLIVVRYSPRESTIPGYMGQDALIRFYKDPEEYQGYNGQVERVVNISQALFGGGTVGSRGDHMDLPVFKQVVEGLDWKVFGPNNELAGDHDGGTLTYEDMKNMLRFNRAYLYLGTRPAGYTLAFIEAMMTGIPIVSVGPSIGNSIYRDQATFEVHEILGESGVAGLWSDSPSELKSFCQILLNSRDTALRIGAAGRGRAIDIFGKAKISKQWQELFEKL